MTRTEDGSATCTGGCACGGQAAPAAVTAGVLSTRGLRESNEGAAPASGRVSRRAVLAGAAASAAAMALAGCASGSEPAASPTTAGGPTGGGATSASPAESSQAGDASPAATGVVLATTTEFPVGGGKVVREGTGVVVVTQPADGDFKAFNGKCPHQGCPVTEVTENTIVCNCHGSVFDAATGDRLEGPAPVGLTPVAITVQGDQILLA